MNERDKALKALESDVEQLTHQGMSAVRAVEMYKHIDNLRNGERHVLLSTWYDISHRVDLLKKLQEQYDLISDVKAHPNALALTIQSTYQDTGLVEAARPAVLAALKARIDIFKSDLLQLGVNCDG